MLGERGFELHGVDLVDARQEGLVDWLQQQGYVLGDFHCADFSSYNPGRQYDVVLSLGFIEHFADHDTIICQQAALVRDGGWLYLTTPNFRAWPLRLWHRIVNPRSFGGHNLRAMDPECWIRTLQDEGFERISVEYVGTAPFWVESEPRCTLLRLCVDRLSGVCRFLLSRLCGPARPPMYCCLCARKRPPCLGGRADPVKGAEKPLGLDAGK